MSTSLLPRFLAWFACAGLLGCGGGDSHPTRASNELLSVEDFARAYTDVMCREARPCCESRGVKLVTADCDLYETTLRDSLKKRITANVAYSAVEASRCVAQTAAAVTRCTLPDEALCNDVLRGSLGLGAVCEQSSECDAFEGASTTCEEDMNGINHCAVGGSRDPDGVKASAGQVCTETCSYKTDGGNSCLGTRFDPAVVPRYCVRQEGLRCGSDGRCGPLLAEGAPCAFFHGECELGLRCGARKCTSRLPLGAACSDSEECVDGAKCSKSICIAPLAVGTACTQADVCKGEAFCDEGACKLHERLDGICEGAIE